MFILSLWDISTDVCYLLSRPAVNDFLWKFSLGTLLLNLFGPMIILVLGQIFTTFINTFIFEAETFDAEKLFKDIIEMIKLSHSFVFKTILDLDIPKKKAIYRVAFLIHAVFESFPQFVLQCVTNQMLHFWLEPLPIISLSSSFTMIIMSVVISIKTDKYYL